MEKTEKIQYNGAEHDFVFRKLTFGEKNKLREDSMDIKVIGGQEIIKVSVTKLIEGSIVKALVKAPFEVNLKNIQDLPPELGERLSDIVQEMNNLSEKKKSKSDNSLTDSALKEKN